MIILPRHILTILLLALSVAPWPAAVGGPRGGGRAYAAVAPAASRLSAPGPFVLASPDSTSELRLRFLGQMMLEYTSTDLGGGERSDALVMHARRIRPVMELRLFKPRLFFRLHMSAAPKSLEMMDYYFDLSLNKNLALRYGQYKVPFTLYRIASFQALTLVDWAIVTKGFGAERQMGFSIHNGYERPPRLGYVFGVFTGVNARASHAIWLPRLYGIKDPPNPSDLSDPAPFAEYHPELFLNLSYNHGNIDVSSGSDGTRDGFRYSAALSAAWDFDPSPHENFKLRLAPELLTKYRGASARAIGYAGFVEPTGCDETELGMLGVLFESAFRFNDRYEIAGRYAAVDFTDRLVDDASEFLGLSDASMREWRTSSIEASGAAAFAARARGADQALAAAPDCGLVELEEEFRVGFDLYLAGDSLKWQNDAGWLRHHYETCTLTDFVVRSQFQIIY